MEGKMKNVNIIKVDKKCDALRDSPAVRQVEEKPRRGIKANFDAQFP